MSLIITCKQRKEKLKAMTLIELLVVVIVVGVIVTFAYPSYLSHVVKAKRGVALSDLSRMQLYLENGYDGGSYANAANALMPGGNCAICESDSSEYTISVSPEGGDYKKGYIITAKPLNQQTKDTCLSTPNDVITLKQTGKGQPLDCWG